jgi:hypothetical protein
MPFLALLDASVLIPFPLADTLLRIAAADLYDPLWSPDILREVERTLAGWPHVGPNRAARRIEHMRSAFPEAEVTGHRHLIETMPAADEADQHVVAAALVGHAHVVVTNNVRHFPAASIRPLGIDVQDPDVFLTHLYHLDPPVVQTVIREQAADLHAPPSSVTEVLRKLEPATPAFVALIRSGIAG